MLELGIDIVSVHRFRENIQKGGGAYLEKMFTPREIEYCSGKARPEQHYAGTFAAKEAVWKALKISGSSGILWKHIEIVRDEGGVPSVNLRPKIEELYNGPSPFRVTISISHCDEYAVANAIVEAVEL